VSNEDLYRRIESALMAGDENYLTKALYDLSTNVMENGEYAENEIERLLALLQSTNARAQSASWMLWKNFEENWALVSQRERELIRGAAENALDQSDESMWSFMIGVLLAECFSDRGALEILARLRLVARERARSLLPDALRNLARHTSDDALRRDARRELSLLEIDRSSVVQKEAAEAVRRWK